MDDADSLGGVQVEETQEQAPGGQVGEVRSVNERIGVGSGDENVARIQLAARWAEAYTPDGGDTLEAALQRFYRAYAYIDAVTHNVAPEQP